jgi:hypothetical protein
MWFFREAEQRWEDAIIERFSLVVDDEIRATVKAADRADYAAEVAERRDSKGEVGIMDEVEALFILAATTLGLS